MHNQYVAGSIVTLTTTAYYVYELLDDDNAVFYVGLTAHPRERLKEHSKRSKWRKNNAVADRIATLKLGLRMHIVSVHTTRDEAEIAEVVHMRKFTDLLNVATGALGKWVTQR